MAAAKAELVEISGTSFLMGSESGADDEQPVHRVWIDAFLLGAKQVTNAEYSEFASPPCSDDSNLNDPAQPVIAVSWFDATRYCEWLTEITGRNFRLPTEAEWEAAARGGSENKLYPWGDEPRRDYPTSGPEKVGRGLPNAYGLYDMCENV